MNILNQIKRAALGAALACALFSPGAVQAFGGGSGGQTYYYPTTTCTLRLSYYASGTAYAYLQTNPSMAGASYWSGGRLIGYTDLSASKLIADCGFSSVTNLVANGANGTFASDDYVGVSFDATEPGSSNIYHYEYALSGATNTQRIATKTLINTDTTPPTIIIGALSGPTGGVYTAAITVSEATTDFIATDLSLTNATATLTGSGTSYTAALTPIAQGPVNVSVGVGQLSDAAGNLNVVASNTAATTFDTLAPTVTITGIPTTITGVTTFPATFTFSEVVVGFTMADIVATNSSVTTLSGSGTTYTATVTATGAGNVGLSVASGAVTDMAGNANAAGAAVGVVSLTVTQTQQVISSAMQQRAASLIANQPNLSGLMAGGGAGTFNANVTKGHGFVDLATSMDNPVWFRLNGSWSQDGAAETQYAFGVIGSHLKFGDNLLVGGMVQFDYSDTEDGVASTKSNGWLVGPYFVARLENQPLTFDGSLLYGKTDNDVSPLGTYSDSFATERFLVTAAVTGQVETQWMTLYPRLSLSHTQDKQAAYTDSLANPIAAQTAALSELSAGLDFSMPLTVQNGDMSLTGGVNGIFSSSDGHGAATVANSDGGRARLDIGLNYLASSGVNTRVSGFYDGLGAQDYEAYGVDLLLEIAF